MEKTGKRKAWYQVKIEDLEAKVAELQAQALITLTATSTTTSSDLVVESRTYEDGFADGYVECMHKYGILSKVLRRRTHMLLKQKGPGAVKGGKRTRFSISVPSL